ncbi:MULTISPECIES: GNAT family N-acetyltransferase [Leisingera]|jgi:GNAT superfamily N-acetyltransferase|uniref:GNAT family N-acetyltransferase n=1 Tax=Leisingera TaxID=191028 RepID=UPI001FD22B6A|nr:MULTISPECIES: GNAT family N-acetyltransferase [Leisingera]
MSEDHLNSLTDAVCSGVKERLPHLARCMTIAGKFDLTELKKRGVPAPAVLVSTLGAIQDTTRAAELKWRRLRRPPGIAMDIHKTDGSYWPLFEPHHYLKLPRMVAADYYVGFVGDQPVAHVAFAPRPGLVEARACRLVIMPEWQGAGLGLRFLNEVCALWRRGVNRYGRPMPSLFHTSHPGLAAALRGHPLWAQVSANLGQPSSKARDSVKGRLGGHFRAVQGFRYVE